eukprot:GILK01015056.1.p1 GENE.GILK01015056.1~~GILK01015056.1.p1  ORF type:complete len:149 (+),score=17.80 GILK01015056.1:319-765(+)
MSEAFQKEVVITHETTIDDVAKRLLHACIDPLELQALASTEVLSHQLPDNVDGRIKFHVSSDMNSMVPYSPRALHDAQELSTVPMESSDMPETENFDDEVWLNIISGEAEHLYEVLSKRPCQPRPDIKFTKNDLQRLFGRRYGHQIQP